MEKELIMSYEEEGKNYNLIIELINKLVDMCGNTDEALKLRDKLFNLFTLKYSKPLYDVLWLQKELGCRLDIMFKALTNGIYTKEYEANDKLELFKVRGIEKNGLGVISKICSYGECDFTCKYEDYKKTWWLREDKSE